ncbi:dipeptide ABC transporter ATP-binding protein [Devosia nitrariae]|uniref:ABC transporter ATP-binding protein n=1 Tax=Devosia nitrariae TaxID=2071872 RepID=A0ABQ5VYX8_9HYPH|nr:ABC transporter ATP-binding protein [Devosia nitrariae]GLQ53027.1 ABC transporter ATP-binding protein [Devosia nitrariae]
MSLVEVANLSIAFGALQAVDGIGFAIGKGERFGLVGESGSGKTLTALAIAGLLPETARREGTIRFDGAPLPHDERALARLRGKRIGMVFQEPMTALNPLMKVGRQIGEALALTKAGGDIGALLTEVGLLPTHGERYPHQLSGGQRQRVMIAMALASAPDILIADEPTSALDLVTQAKVLDLIAALCDRRGMALMFISHDLKAVARLCTRVAVLQRGRMVEAGETASVFGAPGDGYTRRLVAAARMQLPEIAHGSPGGVLVATRGLTRRFRQPGSWPLPGKPLTAVDKVDFAVRTGESIALVGPSGCGKTTLARILVGLDTANAGSIAFDGRVYHGADLSPDLRRDLSLVFQDPFSSFDPRMSVAQSLAEPLRLLDGLPPEMHRQRLAENVAAVGLEPAMLTRFPHEFSGGQRQRLAIARALMTRPKFLVLDEPVSALDLSVRAEVLALLMRLKADYGLTYLVISHDLDMVAAIADRVLVMQAGRIVEEGKPAELFTNPRHEMTRELVAARLPAVG